MAAAQEMPQALIFEISLKNTCYKISFNIQTIFMGITARRPFICLWSGAPSATYYYYYYYYYRLQNMKTKHWQNFLSAYSSGLFM